jgi:TrmH family RNA methyltransferase
MNRIVIESSDNPRVRAWRKLATPKGREAAGAYLVEGPHLVEEAVRAGVPLECVIAKEEHESSPFLRSCAAPVVLVSDKVMRALSDTVNNQGLAAICKMPDVAAFQPQPGCYLLLDGVQDPGNVGTMIRTAAAAGFFAVITGLGCADAFAPKVVRAAQGAIFHIPVIAGELADWLPALRREGVVCLAAAAREGRDFRSVEPAVNIGLVIGNEGAGVRPEVLALCDDVVHIPMVAATESLSAPIAAGILMFHVALSRAPASGMPFGGGG